MSGREKMIERRIGYEDIDLGSLLEEEKIQRENTS
jgi:hypothetical protein